MDDSILLLRFAAYAIALSAAVLLLVPLILADLLLVWLSLFGIKQLLKPELKKPGIVTLHILREGEDGMLNFVLNLPPKSASDVVSRELAISINGAEAQLLTLEADAVKTQEFSGADNAVVAGFLVDIDDAGNRSPAREFTFTLVDTIAPAQPGEIGLEVTSEQ